MADTDNNNIDVLDGKCDIFEVDKSYLNETMAEVSSLVVMARLQAKEAEIRARYAREFASKAVAESLAAHRVSASLAKTSRLVASLALELSNKTNLTDESFIDSESDSRYSSFLSSDTSLQSAGDQGVILSKYDAQFPSDIDVNIGLNLGERSLPTLQEDGFNELIDDSGDVINFKEMKEKNRIDLGEEMKKLEIKRKMMLYRDSKLYPGTLTNKDIALQLTYEEQATQTNFDAQ